MADTNKLTSFLDTNKLNPKRLLAVSHKLETLQRDDRSIKLGKRQGKKAADAGTAKEGASCAPSTTCSSRRRRTRSS
jgi:hypothetical protein